MRIILLSLGLIFAVGINAQSEYQNLMTPQNSSFLKDSTFHDSCHYVDLNGRLHRFDKIVEHQFTFKKGYLIWDGDSLSILNDVWTSIVYYEVLRDTSYFKQCIRFKGNSYGVRSDSRILGKYWLGEDIPEKTRTKSRETRQFKNRLDRREVIFSSDSIGSVMISLGFVANTSTSSNSYIGSIPGNSSAPVYSDGASGSRTSDLSNGSSSLRVEIIEDRKITSLFEPIVKFNSEGKLDKRSSEVYGNIVNALKSNPELQSIFENEFKKCLEERIVETSEQKFKKKWYDLNYSDVLFKMRSKYCSDYLVTFAMSRAE